MTSARRPVQLKSSRATGQPSGPAVTSCRKIGLVLLAMSLPLSLLALFGLRWYLREEFSWRMALDDWAMFIALLALVVTYLGQATGGVGLVLLKKWSTGAFGVGFIAFGLGGLVSCGHFVIEEEVSLILPYAIGGAVAFAGFNLAMKTDVRAARKQRPARGC